MTLPAAKQLKSQLLHLLVATSGAFLTDYGAYDVGTYVAETYIHTYVYFSHYLHAVGVLIRMYFRPHIPFSRGTTMGVPIPLCYLLFSNFCRCTCSLAKIN